MNENNLVPNSNRTPSERRENAKKAGQASGEARRRKANFRKNLNQLLTTPIDSPEWTPLLESLGLDSTLEAALNMAMIKEGLSGNVKAYLAVAKYAGQASETEHELQQKNLEIDKLKAELELLKAKIAASQPDTEPDQDDGFIDALADDTEKDWIEHEATEANI